MIDDMIKTIEQDEILKVVIALVMGTLLGLEREYKRKAAGMRTMTLICVSSTLFTILSAELGYPNSPDRVASNILTGVGFIGAGVIFKGDFTIDGITTAASIWIAAALGMAVGMSEYVLAVVTLAGSLIVLIALAYVERYIAAVNDKRMYTFLYQENKLGESTLEAVITRHGLKYVRLLKVRKDNMIEEKFAIRGQQKKIMAFDDYLLHNTTIHKYEIQTNPL